jgi:hypothetical protein
MEPDTKRTNLKKLVRWSLYLFGLLICGLVVCLQQIGPSGTLNWPPAFLIRPDANMQPTIDALVTNPVKPPDGILIYLLPGSVIKRQGETCVNVLYGFDPVKHFGDRGRGYGIPEATITMDGSSIAVSRSLLDDMGLKDDVPVSSELFCLDVVSLQSGPHLFRIKTYSYKGEPVDYSWVWIVQ